MAVRHGLLSAVRLVTDTHRLTVGRRSELLLQLNGNDTSELFVAIAVLAVHRSSMLATSTRVLFLERLLSGKPDVSATLPYDVVIKVELVRDTIIFIVPGHAVLSGTGRSVRRRAPRPSIT